MKKDNAIFKNEICRYIGVLAAIAMISSIFIPFATNEVGSFSLFSAYRKTDLYLPIMLIAFAAINFIVFAIDFKTEFAYMSVGANIFFLAIQIVSYKDRLNELSIGFYLLAISVVITWIMAFLTNLKSRYILIHGVKVKEEENDLNSNLNVLDEGGSKIIPSTNTVNILDTIPLPEDKKRSTGNPVLDDFAQDFKNAGSLFTPGESIQPLYEPETNTQPTVAPMNILDIPLATDVVEEAKPQEVVSQPVQPQVEQKNILVRDVPQASEPQTVKPVSERIVEVSQVPEVAAPEVVLSQTNGAIPEISRPSQNVVSSIPDVQQTVQQQPVNIIPDVVPQSTNTIPEVSNLQQEASPEMIFTDF